MYKPITQLIAGSLGCHKNKHKRHDLNEASLENWTDTVPFLQLHPVANTTAIETIISLEKIIPAFGIPQKLVYDKETAFMNKNFPSWFHEKD